jgi:hypothetical protein
VDAPVRAPEDLYGLPLEEFTPARDALAKELRAGGRKQEAAEVKSLRKPTLAAWALNRTARHHPDAIGALRAAGADLREAQAEALSGDAGRLRAAGRAVAEEIDRVAALAADASQAAARPLSAAQQEKLVSTLRTAAVDDDAGAALARGVLVDELAPTGFGLLAAGSGDLAATRPPSSAGGDVDTVRSGGVETLPGAERQPKRPKPDKEALEAVEAARRELRRCESEAELAATKARRRAERAEAAMQRAAEAQRGADEARAAAEDAAGEAEAARRRATEAADALAAAEAALPS